MRLLPLRWLALRWLALRWLTCCGRPPSPQPLARAAAPFDASEPGDLAMASGDLVDLTGRVDADWLEGAIGGRAGHFPESFVDVLVPIDPCAVVSSRQRRRPPPLTSSCPRS